MSGIHWLASYPKSGNTWARAMLQSCLGARAEIDINALDLGHFPGQSRSLFDDLTGVPAAELTVDEGLVWRAEVIRLALADIEQPWLFKTHDMHSKVGGVWLHPVEETAGALYFLRDPRDVAPSLARHRGVSIDEAITLMAARDKIVAASKRRLLPALANCWGSWSQHVESWLAADFPVTLMRYEESRADPAAALDRMLAAIGQEVPAARRAAAVAESAIERLRAQEAATGFREWRWEGRFFGPARAGGWREVLTAGQVARIEADHGPTMRMLGYL